MFQSIATVENISVSAPMCARGLFITSDSTGAVRRTARPSKARAWKIRSLESLVEGGVGVGHGERSRFVALKSGCIVIGLWDRLLDTIGKPICICRPNPLEAFVQAALLLPAAAQLGKSQSTVSEAIARLEIDLGLELFDRSGRQPQLTEAGRTLLGRVEEVLGASDRLRRVAALLAGGSEPRVTLALSDTYHSARYEARLAELDERYPELEFECLIAEDQDVIAQVGSAAPRPRPARRAAALPAGAGRGGGRRACRVRPVRRRRPSAGGSGAGQRARPSEWRLLRLNTYSETGAAINDGLPSSGGRCWSAPNYLLLLEMATTASVGPSCRAGWSAATPTDG